MSEPINLVITATGLDKLVDAELGNTDPIEVVEIGLTGQAFDPAPTLEALPGEFKRIASVSGQSVSANVIHMTAHDPSAEVYDLLGIGLYLSDGTLFASYGQEEPLFRKVSISDFLLAFDVRFSGDIAEYIQFGDASFLYPPATETVKGVARIATQARVDADNDAGDDAETIVTPRTLRARLTALWTAIVDLVQVEAVSRANADNAIKAVNISGGGLATGGGDLTASRTITVEAASAAELRQATEANKVVTPAAFGGLPRQTGATSYEVLPGGMLIQRSQVRSTYSSDTTVTITFPLAFADTNYDLQVLTVIPAAGDYDNYLQEVNGTRTRTGVTLQLQDPSSGGSNIVAGFNWRAEGRYA